MTNVFLFLRRQEKTNRYLTFFLTKTKQTPHLPSDDGMHSGAPVPDHEDELGAGEQLRQIARTLHGEGVLRIYSFRRFNKIFQSN